jgi:predicted CXXCH cytochrome family protein
MLGMSPFSWVSFGMRWCHVREALCALVFFASYLAQAHGNCLACHRGMTQKKVVHAAVYMGCEICHANLDTSSVRHRNTGPFAKGLLAESSLLCGKCHDNSMFEGRMVHAPVTAGLCMVCHNPHASDNQGLLKMKPAMLCLDCHTDVGKGQHVIVGGHPLGNSKQEVPDPKRQGKNFYCAGCHEPHRSEQPKLTRYGIEFDACQHCHDK